MSQPSESWLHHPEFGVCPAIPVLDCVFALAPNGRILHLHREQMRIEEQGAKTDFHLTDAPPLPERARCQVIPPHVTAFPSLSEEA